jgi:hypothetical protein
MSGHAKLHSIIFRQREPLNSGDRKVSKRGVRIGVGVASKTCKSKSIYDIETTPFVALKIRVPLGTASKLEPGRAGKTGTAL